MKKLMCLIVVITIVLSGCSSKTKDNKKTTQKTTEVTEEKKEEKKEEVKDNVAPVSNIVSDEDRHQLDFWVKFLSNAYHFPLVDEMLDFNNPNTIDQQFYYVIDYLEESNLIQYDIDLGYTIPEELINSTGLKLFNKEYGKDSGGKFTEAYDDSTKTYKFSYGGRGGAGLPYFNASEVDFSTEDQVNFTINAPYYSMQPQGIEYEHTGTIVFHLRKTNDEIRNIYLVSSEIIPL